MSGHDGGRAGAVDLDRMSVQQLTALIEAAEAKRRDKHEEAKAALRAEVERKAAELGISVGELFAQAGQRAPTEQRTRGRRPRSDAGAKVAAKYRDPETGETWSGRGRPPRWLAAREAEGRRREEFAVEPELGLP
jgi:DNA-binding protein H-NS